MGEIGKYQRNQGVIGKFWGKVGEIQREIR